MRRKAWSLLAGLTATLALPSTRPSDLAAAQTPSAAESPLLFLQEEAIAEDSRAATDDAQPTVPKILELDLHVKPTGNVNRALALYGDGKKPFSPRKLTLTLQTPVSRT